MRDKKLTTDTAEHILRRNKACDKDRISDTQCSACLASRCQRTAIRCERMLNNRNKPEQEREKRRNK
eukprot:766710-Hanusia_phi.AAC.12